MPALHTNQPIGLRISLSKRRHADISQQTENTTIHVTQILQAFTFQPQSLRLAHSLRTQGRGILLFQSQILTAQGERAKCLQSSKTRQSPALCTPKQQTLAQNDRLSKSPLLARKLFRTKDRQGALARDTQGRERFFELDKRFSEDSRSSLICTQHSACNRRAKRSSGQKKASVHAANTCFLPRAEKPAVHACQPQSRF